MPPYSAAQHHFAGVTCSSSGTLCQGAGDQAAAASLDKVVPVSCYVLETL